MPIARTLDMQAWWHRLGNLRGWSSIAPLMAYLAGCASDPSHLDPASSGGRKGAGGASQQANGGTGNDATSNGGALTVGAGGQQTAGAAGDTVLSGTAGTAGTAGVPLSGQRCPSLVGSYEVSTTRIGHAIAPPTVTVNLTDDETGCHAAAALEYHPAVPVGVSVSSTAIVLDDTQGPNRPILTYGEYYGFSWFYEYHFQRIVLWCGLVAGMGTLTGCATEESADQQPLAATTQAEGVLFSEHYSETGSMTVFETPDGRLSVTVTGAIGSDDDQRAGAAMIQPTLIDTFKVLTGRSDSEISPELRELSIRHAQQQSAAIAEAQASDEPASPSVEAQAAEAATKSFSSQVCRTFVEGSSYYTPVACPYVSSCAIPNSGPDCFVRVTGATLRSVDRSYAWNNTKWNAFHGLMYSTITPRMITPYTWTWTMWGISGTAYPYLSSSPNDAAGNIGVTVHRWSVVIT